MRKSVQTAARTPVAGKSVLTKPMWFVPTDASRPSYADVCKRRGWTPIETWGSHNPNDAGLVLAMDRKGRVFLIGSEPHVQQLTLAEAMEFYAAMNYEAQEGSNEEAFADFFTTIAAALQKGGAR